MLPLTAVAILSLAASWIAQRSAWSAETLHLAQDLRWGWPYGPAYSAAPWIDPAYGWYGYSPCYPFASCGSAWQNQRQERQRMRALELELHDLRQTPPPGIEAWGGWRPPQQRNAETSKREAAQLQAPYAASGEIRKEYIDSGEFLPQFLDGSVRPQ